MLAAVDPWRFDAHPEVWVVMAGAAWAYWWATHRLAARLVPAGDEAVSPRQQAWFYGGVGVLFVLSQWPIHDIGEEYLFWVHMVQHLGYTLVAPPMLLMGLPAWLVRWLCRTPVLGFCARRLALPLPAAVIFNFLTVFTHWPVIVDATVRNGYLHFSFHTILLTSGLLLWFPVVNTLDEFPRLRPGAKCVYLFLQSVIPVGPVSFLTLATKPVYSVYAAAPRAFGLDAVSDQQIAAAVMKVGGAAFIWGVMIYVFALWWKHEQSRPETRARPPRPPRLPDGLTWDDVEPHLGQPASTTSP